MSGLQSNRMHILIVAYHFPPDRAVGALRPARMAEALRAAGHRVSVIAAKLPGEVQPVRPAASGMGVFAVRPVPGPRELYLGAKRIFKRSISTDLAASRTDASLGPAASSVTPPLWKRSILAVLWLPDDRQGFIPSAVARARAIHRHHPVDVVLTTAPPFSAHLAGLIIRRVTGARWVADFRDPWTGNPWKPAEIRTAGTDRVEARMERRVLERADLVISASAGIQQGFERNGLPGSKLLLVRNGIDTIGARSPRVPGAPFRILHMGTFYHARDPRPFLEALARVRRDMGLSGTDLVVDFVGSSREFDGSSIPQMVEGLGLENVFTFHDFMPRERAIAMAAEADLLLLLAQNQPDQVPQKLYEYLGTRVPILAFADEEGESARLLRHVGGHHVVANNGVDAAYGALKAALTRRDVEPAGEMAALMDLTADSQIRRLIDALEA